MIIRKLFKFENAHIVRGCTTQKCSQNIHGHSYEVEVLLQSNFLDDGQMVYDFGLVKHTMHTIIDAFDHSITLWSKDNKEYLNDIKKHSARWVELPVSPSAEQFSRIFYLVCEKIISTTKMSNGEKNVAVYSVIVHETKTGYAQAFYDDAHSKLMGLISLNDITFSPAIKQEWEDIAMWDKVLNDKLIPNPLKI